MKRLLIILVALIWGVATYCDEQQVTLNDGLKVLAVQRSRADVAAWNITFRYPAFDKSVERPGLRGVVQQLLLDAFQNRLNTGPEFSTLRDERDAGAFTTFGTEWEYVEARGKTASQDLAPALKLLAATLFETKPSVQMLAAARAKITPADDRDAANVAEGTFYLFRRALEGDEAPTGSVYGTATELAAIAPEDVAQALSRYYVASNACLTVVAPQSAAQIIGVVRATFEGAPKAAAVELPPPPARPSTSEVRVGDISGSDRASMIVGVGLPPFGAPDFYIGQIIAACLEGKGGRLERDYSLFRTFGLSMPARIVAGGAAQPLDVPLTSRPYIAIHAYVSPGSLEDASQALKHHLLAFADEAVSDKEFARAKARTVSLNLREADLPIAYAARLNLYQLYGLDYRADAQLPDRVAQVTRAQIAEFAQKYFTRVAIGVRCPS